MKKNIVAISLFLILSFVVILIPPINFDLRISQLIQGIDSKIFSQIMWFVSSMGNQPLMIYLIGTVSLLLFFIGMRKEAILCTLSSAGSALSGSFIKILVGRPRPEANFVRVSTWLSDKSFPSNHVLVFTTFFGFLLYLLLHQKKHQVSHLLYSIPLILLIFSIGISRIYLGVHWATDVLGGYLFGLIWLMFTIRLYNSNHGQR